MLSPSPACRLARLFLEWEYSFVKTVVVLDECSPCGPGVADTVLRAASSCQGPVRLLARLRGPCKEAIDPEAVLRRLGIPVSRGSRRVFAVESLPGWVMAVCGRARVRPYGALIVAPERCLSY